MVTKRGKVPCLMCSLAFSLRASFPIWASEASLARLASLAQIGELARMLISALSLDRVQGTY